MIESGQSDYFGGDEMTKAAELGHWYSKEELSRETAETKPTMNRIRGVNGNDKKPGYSAIPRGTRSINNEP